jgi:hypothetical protein
MPKFFLIVALTMALVSDAVAQFIPTTGPQTGKNTVGGQTLPPVPPRLSMARRAFFEKNPGAWQSLLARLPRVPVGPAKARPAGGPWQAVAAIGPASGLSAPLLLTDGTVIVHALCTPSWYKLTPDITGSYVNGTWSQIGSLPAGYAPLFFASAVLSDGRVIINGGEYNTTSCAGSSTNLGAIYDPVGNTWAAVTPPSGWAQIGDAQGVVLANGTYMLANCCATPPKAALLNASNLTWTATGNGKFDVYKEEGWTLLPDGTILTADGYDLTGTCGTNTERYNPSTGTWISAGNSPVQLSDCNGFFPSYEVGPQVLRPDGTVVAFSGVASGVVAGTAIFNTSNMTWAAGPNLPTISGQNYDLADAPAAWLPSGNILFAASPGLFNSPTHFFVFSSANVITQVADTPNSPIDASYKVNFLVLPTGQVLQTDFSSTVEIYTPSGSANSSWAPVIASVPTTLAPGQTYQVAGLQLNGLTEGAAYGDDQQSATDFPLVRITNNRTGHVFYARTSGFSTRSIAVNATSTANFDVPANIETGASSLVVVANGIASSPVNVTIGTVVNGSLLVSPATGIVGSGTQYGPFSPSSFHYSLNASRGSVNFAITHLPSWLNATPTSGTVTTTPTVVTFTFNINNSANLPVGFYAAGCNFVNTTNGQGSTTRIGTLTVQPLVRETGSFGP